MEACVDRAGEVDYEELSALNGRFHREVLAGAGSDRLSVMLASVVHVPLVVQTFTRYSPEALTRSMNHHRELVAAIRAGVPDWAGSVMRSHIIAAGAVLVTTADARTRDGSGAG
jgi:DNA-binding GntR family transcriptional regulator